MNKTPTPPGEIALLRQRLEFVREQRWISYAGLLWLIEQWTGERVRDIGELSASTLRKITRKLRGTDPLLDAPEVQTARREESPEERAARTVTRNLLAQEREHARASRFGSPHKEGSSEEITGGEVKDQNPDCIRQQELLMCQIAWDAIQSREESPLRWFTTDVLKRPSEWTPVVAMALDKRNQSGEPKWRDADRPLRLLRTISWRTAFKWHPELLFEQAGPRARHAYDLEGERPRLRNRADTGCFGDRILRGYGNVEVVRRPQSSFAPLKPDVTRPTLEMTYRNDDGDEMSYSEQIDRLSLPACFPEVTPHLRRRGIGRTIQDDPERANYVNGLLRQRGVEVQEKRADPQGVNGARGNTVLHWSCESEEDFPFWDEEGREVPLLEGQPIAADVLVPGDDNDRLVIDWEVVARKVGFDRHEATLLKARSQNVSRERMAQHLSWDAHKVEAVWRSLNRQFDDPQVVDRLRDVLLGQQTDNHSENP